MTGVRKSSLARYKEFVRHFCAGEDGVRGVISASYLAAGFQPKTRGSLDASASILFKKPIVQQLLGEFQAKADAVAIKKNIVPWQELVPDAQAKLIAGMEGNADKTQIAAADKILDRALGKPTTKVLLGGGEGMGLKSLTVKFVKATTEAP